MELNRKSKAKNCAESPDSKKRRESDPIFDDCKLIQAKKAQIKLLKNQTEKRKAQLHRDIGIIAMTKEVDGAFEKALEYLTKSWKILEMHYVKYWMKKRSIHRGYYGHLLRIFFCYLHLGKRDEAADFTENRHFCSDDEATLEEVMLALYDWRQSKIKAETETFVAFEETLANSIPGSYFERLYGNKPALDLIKKYLVEYEQQPLEVKASELMKKYLHEFNFSDVARRQVYQITCKNADQNFLLGMTRYEAPFIVDFCDELGDIVFLSEGSSDESSSAE